MVEIMFKSDFVAVPHFNRVLPVSTCHWQGARIRAADVTGSYSNLRTDGQGDEEIGSKGFELKTGYRS